MPNISYVPLKFSTVTEYLVILNGLSELIDSTNSTTKTLVNFFIEKNNKICKSICNENKISDIFIYWYDLLVQILFNGQ